LASKEVNVTIVQRIGAAPFAAAVPAAEDETRRTTPLAYWRYAHDYLRVVRDLSRQHRIACAESQAVLHLAAQAIDFALLAFTTAYGASVNDARANAGRSLECALARARALGLPPLARRWHAAVAELAACVGATQFTFLQLPEGAVVDLDPVIEAGVFILDRCAPEVAESFVFRYGDGDPSSAASLLQRLRADLAATADIDVIRSSVVTQ
jgi:hypothetical protein